MRIFDCLPVGIHYLANKATEIGIRFDKPFIVWNNITAIFPSVVILGE